MFKKLACFSGWLVVIFLSLLFCFIFGLWQSWRTPTILLFWLFMLFLAPLLWIMLRAVILVITGKKTLRLLNKYRLSRRQYVLMNHWKAGANVIRQTQRNRARLSWFLLAGERCGKSTLIANSGIPRFYGETDTTMIAPTRTLNWWFFRNIGILDLSSNFLNGTPSFRQSWKKLALWCMRMPAPAGIIIAISVTDLMKGESETLHELARKQRALIDPLVRRFQERLPLHIMITQCDCFPGFSVWQQQLSPRQKQHPLGYSWRTPPNIDGQDEHTLQPLFFALKQGFSQTRLSMARPDLPSMQDYALLLDFPEAFCKLESALRHYLTSLCEPNAYFSHSPLSSVWFSASESQTENQGRRVSHFVHDLFSGGIRDVHWSGNQQRHWYQRRRGKRAGILLLVVCLLWVCFSAVLSSARLQPDIDNHTPDELAAFMASEEQYSVRALAYLPFQPLLQQQYSRAESRLLQVTSAPRPVQQTLADYQQRALSASPAQQRTYILQLAHAVHIWQQMKDNVPLNTLLQPIPVAEELLQRSYPGSLTPLARLALERYYVQHPGGERWLQSAKQVLIYLVNHDTTLEWLLENSVQFPPLPAANFWTSLPERVALPGIWSHRGALVTNEWMSLIEQAVGRKLAVFQEIKKNWPQLQQAAWRQYLIEVAAALSVESPKSMNHSQLIALGQNQSKAMQFVDKSIRELRQIPDEQAENWLTTLRRIHQLSVRHKEPAILAKARHADDQFRHALTTWIQGKTRSYSPEATEPTSTAWAEWQNVRNLAVKDAVSLGTTSSRLTRGLFGGNQQTDEKNPLLNLFPALVRLQERLSPENADATIAAVWQLYQNDARQLLAHATAQSACWLNEQWKSTVIWPLDKNAPLRSYEEQQSQSQQYVSEFVRGPAKTLLVADKNGPTAGSFRGITVPLSADFLRLIRRSFSPEVIQDISQRASTHNSDQRAVLLAKAEALEEQLVEKNVKEWKTSLASMPATIPGGARMIPTGTKLTLHCQKGDQILNSMNFAEKHEFIWHIGECKRVTLHVIFPGFTISHRLDGDDGWIRFINRFTSGEALFGSHEFENNVNLLNDLGIKNILVRFAVSDPGSLNDAWQIWSDLVMRINGLREQITQLDTRIQQQQREKALANPLSAIPADIAQCQ